MRNRLVATGMVLVLAVLLALLAGPARAADWTGSWDTRWRGDGAVLDLRQEGQRVTGAYPLYNGRVEGEVRGRELHGSWTEGDRSGRFLFVMSDDGKSFMGRFDSGEWWTGGRVAAGDARLQADQASPRRAMRSFLTATNRARAGNVEAWGAAVALLDFGDAGAALRPGQRIAAAQRLSDAIDLTTLRLWTIPGEPVAGDEVAVTLAQAGTDRTLPLGFRRRDGAWFLVMPDAALLAERTQAMQAARGGVAAADAHLTLRSPRDVFLTLLDRRAPDEARLSAFDLAGVAKPVRAHEGALAAEYLQQVLARIGPVLPQEVPDDPTSTRPYVHFEHPLGRVVVARDPDAVAAGTPAEWRVARETVEALRPLYAALETMPADPEAAATVPPPSGFFVLRRWIGGEAPDLLLRLGPVEAWQLLGVALVVAVGWLLGLLAGWPAAAILRAATGAPREEAARIRWPARLVAASSLWLVGTEVLGLPDVVQTTLQLLFTTALALGVAWAGWHVVDAVARRLAEHAQKTAAQMDEIMVSLIAGAAKLLIVLGALLWVATALAIPVAGIIAGLGVGGIAFAFASRETLQNVFGAGILLTDRPFRRGDWIAAGEVRGTVEKVGIRSTRIRTAEDSLMIVPNGRLADATINNMGTRRHRLATGKIVLGWGARPEQVDALLQGIRDILAAREEVVRDRVLVGATDVSLRGVEIEFSGYLATTTTAEERAARHAILREVLALVHRLGLAGIVVADASLGQPPPAPAEHADSGLPAPPPQGAH
jgi:small-conductance mechanosensitive channel